MSKINLKGNMKQKFTVGEEVSHAVTHGIGALLGVAALITLIIQGTTMESGLYMASMIVYGVTLIILYTNSSLYHAITHVKVKHVFEKMDHLSIYLLIAGTYTPYCLLAVGGKLGIGICIAQWALAIAGVVIKAIWLGKYQKIHLLIYLAMGWMIVFFSGSIYHAISPIGFWLLVGGGLAYSIGVLFYAFRWFKYHHFVWHLFVMMGSLCHFYSIYLYVR